jgi:hypothetical protein
MINKKRNVKKMKKTKKVITPVKPFVVGQLAFHDIWDDGRGDSSTTTGLCRIRELQTSTACTVAVVILEDGTLAIVGVKNLRHLPDCFNGATI